MVRKRAFMPHLLQEASNPYLKEKVFFILLKCSSLYFILLYYFALLPFFLPYQFFVSVSPQYSGIYYALFQAYPLDTLSTSLIPQSFLFGQCLYSVMSFN